MYLPESISKSPKLFLVAIKYGVHPNQLILFLSFIIYIIIYSIIIFLLIN